jgi:thiamine monophosphate synthase
LITLAKAVKEICNGYKATLIINDNVYLAQQIAAEAAHENAQNITDNFLSRYMNR